ncbi:MAG: hypothetical protein KAR40_12115, partial [Candidatus Sabulitectum sp.]|nr:hypothetical protein [Candidatus Sabulitectum sp.]
MSANGKSRSSVEFSGYVFCRLASILVYLRMIIPNISSHKGLIRYHPEFVLINESTEVPVSFLFGIQALIDNYLGPSGFCV